MTLPLGGGGDSSCSSPKGSVIFPGSPLNAAKLEAMSEKLHLDENDKVVLRLIFSP